MRTPLYRMERDGSETIVGYAGNVTEVTLLMTADRENVDWDVGYRWHKPQDGEEQNEPKRNDP